MPNPQPDTKGLNRGGDKALAALGVEKLAEGEASRPVRIRTSHAVHKRLKEMSAKEIGEVLTRALG